MPKKADSMSRLSAFGLDFFLRARGPGAPRVQPAQLMVENPESSRFRVFSVQGLDLGRLSHMGRLCFHS